MDTSRSSGRLCDDKGRSQGLSASLLPTHRISGMKINYYESKRRARRGVFVFSGFVAAFQQFIPSPSQVKGQALDMGGLPVDALLAGDNNALSMTQQNNKATWFMALIGHAQAFAEKVGLDDDQTMALREIIVTIAKEQYMAGNRAGIAWAKKNMPVKAMALGVASITANQIVE